MRGHGAAVQSGVQSGVDGVRLGSDTDRDAVAAAIHGALVKELEAQRRAVEAFNNAVQHVGIGVEVQRNNSAGAHQHILCSVHHLKTDSGLGAGLDVANQNIVSLSPGAVLDLDIVAQIGQIQVINSSGLMGAAAKLNIVVAGGGDPHIQEGDGVIVVAEPAVTGDGVIAGLTGVQEGSPLLVLQLDIDAHSSQSGLDVLTNGLVTLRGVVQVGQSGEVGEHTVLVHLVVLAEDLISLGIVVLESVGADIVVAHEAVVVAGVLIELAAVRLGQAHGHEGGSGQLATLSNLLNDVVAVQQQSQSVADLGLGSCLLFCGHLSSRCFGSSGGAGSGSLSSSRSGRTAAGHQGQSHSQNQKQGNHFLHFLIILS